MALPGRAAGAALVSSQGESRGAPGHANTGTHASLATQALQDVTNEMAGISGEHIADYICAYTQLFLQDAYDLSHRKYLGDERDYWRTGLQGVGETESEKRMLALGTHSRFAYEHLSLRYTAGEPIENLRDELTGVIEAYERFQAALATYEGVPTMAPLGLGDIGDCERCTQLIGVSYLLHRRELLPRLAAMIDPGYRGEDTLYEDLLHYALARRPQAHQRHRRRLLRLLGFQHSHLSPETLSSSAARPRCEANAPCPREGYWFTPAKAGSRRFFKQGETMPDLKTDYGLTIWQWDLNPSA